MALNTVAAIREWRERLTIDPDQDTLVAFKVGTVVTMVDTLLAEVDRLSKPHHKIETVRLGADSGWDPREDDDIDEED